MISLRILQSAFPDTNSVPHRINLPSGPKHFILDINMYCVYGYGRQVIQTGDLIWKFWIVNDPLREEVHLLIRFGNDSDEIIMNWFDFKEKSNWMEKKSQNFIQNQLPSLIEG